MKKILVLCLCLSLFVLSACGADTDAKFPVGSVQTTAPVVAEGGKPIAPVVPSGVSPTASPSESRALSGFADLPDSALSKITAAEATDLANAVKGSTVSSSAKPYAGLWHASRMLGSGWNERYLLSYDGTFLWIASQMDGEARTRYVYGAWDVSGGNIELDVRLALMIEGGELTASPSTMSGTAITGGTLVPYAVAETFILTLTAPQIDPDMLPDREMYAITINGDKYWYYANEDDNNAAFDEFWETLYSLESPATAGVAWQSAYNKIIAVYRAALNNGFAQYDENIVSAAMAAEMLYDAASLVDLTFYAYYDIDGNGTPELVIGVGDAGLMTIYDLYAFDGKNAVRLVENDSLGYRAWANINADGIIPLWGGEGAGVGSWRFYRIAADGYTPSLVEEIGMVRGANWDNDSESLDYYHTSGAGANSLITKEKYAEIGGKYLKWDGEYLSGSLVPMDWKPITTGGQANVPTAMFRAYAEIVEAGEAIMTLPGDLSKLEYPDMAAALDIGSGKIEVRDVTGDGIPELICLTQNKGYEEWLNVWTWRGGKAEKVFEQRVRSLAGGGGNYCAYITNAAVGAGGELYVYSSENGSNFDYGFWNVSAYIIKNANVGYASEPYAFIGNRENALMFCRITEGDVDNAKYQVNGKDSTAAVAADWLGRRSESIDAVLMDSKDSKMTSSEGREIDVGLYSEKLGPWAKYVPNPHKSSCMTWEFALTYLRGDRG